MNYFKKTCILLVFCSLVVAAEAQCKIENNAFATGENIAYDLYFNMGILSAKAGSGSLNTSMVNYNGNDVFKITMLLNTGGLAGNIYTVNDTLTSYIDKDMRPKLFTKEAFEGKDYSRERQIYTYQDDQINIRAMRVFRGKQLFDESVSTTQCAYDYLSILAFVRNLDYSAMEPGDKVTVQFLSGKDIVNMYINYLRKSTIKANNGQKYQTIDLSMTILDKAFKNPKDAIKASLTDDLNRLPVIIETSLNIGSVKAVLRNVSGQRN